MTSKVRDNNLYAHDLSKLSGLLYHKLIYLLVAIGVGAVEAMKNIGSWFSIALSNIQCPS